MCVSEAEADQEYSGLLNYHISDDPSAKLVAESRFGADRKKKEEEEKKLWRVARERERVIVTAALVGEKMP